ncbi:MAG: hypothetical protein IKN54_00175 [Lachnospiraceae bacterium]|nr:hypothetical protein [Lachnospiraceae bacterium]
MSKIKYTKPEIEVTKFFGRERILTDFGGNNGDGQTGEVGGTDPIVSLPENDIPWDI